MVVIGIGAAYAVGAKVSIMGAAIVVIGIGAAYAAGDAYAVGANVSMMGAPMVVMGIGAAMVVIGKPADMEPTSGAPIYGAAPIIGPAP
jgi:hypothetical protein